MLIRESKKNISPEIWALSEKDDVIITKENSAEQRVIINYKIYESIKQALTDRKKIKQQSNSAESFDLNPYLQDFIDILQNDQFEDITDDDHYFENFARKIKSKDNSKN